MYACLWPLWSCFPSGGGPPAGRVALSVLIPLGLGARHDADRACAVGAGLGLAWWPQLINAKARTPYTRRRPPIPWTDMASVWPKLSSAVVTGITAGSGS